jgi:hypothetical protein
MNSPQYPQMQREGEVNINSGNYSERYNNGYPLNVQSFMQPYALSQQQICMQTRQQQNDPTLDEDDYVINYLL